MMTRQDGRQLYFDHPVTGMDMIDYATDVEIPENVIRCRVSREPLYEAWMDDI